MLAAARSFIVMTGLMTLIPAGAPSVQLQQPAVIDHFILAINDLARGVAEFERRTGVRPVFGGVHPGRGTQNALASLGDGRYIEILAPDPKQPSPTQPIEGLKALTMLTPSGWALGTTDVFAMQARLTAREIHTSVIRPGSRALPDGSMLEWSTFGVTEPAHAWLPFFIRWKDPAKQPSTTAPAGCRLESVRIEDPRPDPLTHVLLTAGLKIPVSKGEVSRMTIALQCPKGAVTFR
ncbi:MAG: VOC family protein [Acidobacteriota bacterium]|nr:VOC family protein [Acidobacteriota bacterium]